MKRLLIFLAFLALVGLACSKSASNDIASTETAMPAVTQTANPPATSPVLTMQPAIAENLTRETTCTVTGDLHLRDEPRADARVVGWLRSGDVVASIPLGDAVATSGDWRAVQTASGLGGYAHAGWLDCGGE